MVDVQERLVSIITEGEAVERNAVRLLKTADVLSLPVLYTEQYPKGIGPTAAEVFRALPKGSPRFEKTSFFCCDEPGFLEAFEKNSRATVVIFGIESHICVLSTAMDLQNRGYQVVFAADASGTRSPENHALALCAARDFGVAVLPTETIVYQLLERSGTPEFKALLPLFK